ncbi:MAG: hypothetical protein D9V44_01295 [Actinobacteria bacterium]|nr:MAG: hypothetical protein D9V44_01295 [Actinomycetota bacterium]
MQYYFGPFGDVTGMSYPGVVDTYTVDLNANTGFGPTGGTLRVYEVFSDGAVGMKRYLYFGVATIGQPGLSEMISAGGVVSGHVYGEFASALPYPLCVGRAYYFRLGHLQRDGFSAQTGVSSPGLTSSIYYVMPYPVSCEIVGAVQGHWYGSAYVR